MLSTGLIVLISVGATAAAGLLVVGACVLCGRGGGCNCKHCPRNAEPSPCDFERSHVEHRARTAV